MLNGCTTEEKGEDRWPCALKDETGWELIDSSRSLAVPGLTILRLRLLQPAWSSLISSSCFRMGAIPEEIEEKLKLWWGEKAPKIMRGKKKKKMKKILLED